MTDVDARKSVAGLVEAASKGLATDKDQMEAVLATWEDLGRQQGADPLYLEETRD
jgi:hypothetical protein